MHTRLKLQSGVELDVIQSGDPTGVPLLLLHGISDSAPSMRPFMSELPPNVRAIAISQRGHGDSSKPAGPYTLDAMAADAAEALDRLGVRRTVVMGHSMGSMVAQRFAAAHPDRTRGLVLVGAFPGLKGNPEVDAFYQEGIRDLQDPIDPAFARGFQESTLARPVPPDFLDMVSAESLKLPAHAWKALFADMMSRDLGPGLARVRAPTLLLWGDRDAFASARDQERLLKGLPDATLRTLPGTGHAPHWEEPAAAARAVAEFVGRLRAPAAA
ncbi:alpha/beta fold hydrolase [Phenylobacterium sp.]|uniref:alpha/beta fold hydrolase n=1 Tax=Phenylobacterium sp. TaxID=1871053 RepID=UPI002FE294C6